MFSYCDAGLGCFMYHVCFGELRMSLRVTYAFQHTYPTFPDSGGSEFQLKPYNSCQ